MSKSRSRSRGRPRSPQGQPEPARSRVEELEAELERERALDEARFDARISDAVDGRAGGDPKVIYWRGQALRLPDSADDWDLETAEAFERQQMMVALAGMIGKDNWAKIKASGAKVRDIKKLIDQVSQAYGFGDAGESGASTD